MKAIVLALCVLRATAAAAGVCNVHEHGNAHDGVEIKSWSDGAHRLVLCSYYGYALKNAGKDKWLVSELFAVDEGPVGSRFLLDVPSDTEAELVVAPPTFVFTILTYRSEAEQRVPLVRHEVVLTSHGATHRTFFVLVGKQFSEKRFRELVRRFGDPETTSEQREHVLYLIRDQGVSRPIEALRRLAALRGSPYADGHIGEELSEIIGELQLARDLPHRQPNQRLQRTWPAALLRRECVTISRRGPRR